MFRFLSVKGKHFPRDSGGRRTIFAGCGGFLGRWGSGGGCAAVAEDGGHVRLRPGGELRDEGDEGLPEGREAVFDFGGDFGVDATGEESVGLKVLEGGGQDAGGDVGDEAAECVETHDLLLAENQDDEKRPFVAEAGYDVADGADFDEGVFFFAFEHGFQMRGYLRRQS